MCVCACALAICVGREEKTCTRTCAHSITFSIQHSAFSIQRRRDSSSFSIQHSAFSAGGIHHHSASSIQHSAQEAFIILQHSAFSAGGLHHSAQEASSFSDEDRVRWQYNPRTTAKDHQGKCVRWQYNPGGIHHHSAFRAGGFGIQHSAQEVCVFSFEDSKGGFSCVFIRRGALCMLCI